MSQPLEQLRAAAAARTAAGVRRTLVPRGPDGDGLIDLASNDYLGLAADKRLAAGATPGAVGGALGGPARGAGGVLIVSDAGNHASLIDAFRLARARVVVTPHRDAGAVRQVLASREEAAAIVVSDAVFSVDGALAPVAALHAAARESGALLVLDEAHSFGVVGPGGRGAAAAA